MNFILTAFVFGCLYSLVGLSGAYIYRRLRLVSVAQAAVLGTSAYVFAIHETRGGLTYLSAILAVVAAAAVGSILVGLSERVVGEDYALLTFAVQMMWSGIVSNWTGLTRGPLGISGLGDRLSLGSINPLYGYAVSSAILASGTFWLARRQEVSLFSNGAAVVARSSELASTVGIPPLFVRLQVGAASGAVAGVAGVFLALFVSFVDPSSYSIETAVVILAISFFGLTGNLGKILLGSALLVLVPEMARFAGMAGARAGYLQLLLAGTAICVGSGAFLRSPH
jgi:branched-chain amino acid transport system permease protein